MTTDPATLEARLHAVLAELKDILSTMAAEAEAQSMDPQLQRRLIDTLARITATQRRSWKAH